MADPKTLLEFFIELCISRETGELFSPDYCYTSAEELALAA